MSVTVTERTDTRTPRLQVVIWAMAPGQLRAQRYRYNAPRSITSKTAALRWGEQVRREIEAGRPPPQSREGRQKVAAEKAEQARSVERPTTIRDAVEIYLADCAGRGHAPSSLEAKRYKLRHVIEIVGDVSIAAAGEPEASRVRSAMRGKGYATTTINTTMHIFAAMLRRCQTLRLRGPVEDKIETVRERKVAVPKAYDDGTYEMMVSVAQGLGPKVVATVLVAGEAALRVGELLGLECRDIDCDRRTLRVERSVAPNGEIGPPKNGEERTVIMTERLAEVLRPLVEGQPGSAPVFAGRFGGRLTRAGVRDRLRRVQETVGLQVKGPHALRHTAAVSALAGGAHITAVQKLLGHRHLSTTVGTYLTDTGDGPKLASEAITRARSGQPAGDTDLTRTPKTRPLLVTRTYQKRK